MGPLLKYGIHLGIFATTFYFSYSGAEVQKMTLGNLFDNPIVYLNSNEDTSNTIDKTSLNKIACLISGGKKQSELCKTNENEATGNIRYIHKYSYMKMYPEVEAIFNASWPSQEDSQQTFDEKKLFPPLIKWCEGKRREYITALDQQLLWHMTTFYSAYMMPFKKN